METATGIPNRTIRQSIELILTSLLLIVVHVNVSQAQTTAYDKSLKSYKLPSNVKKHFVERYNKNNDRIDTVMSSLRATPLGPRGRISFSGHIISFTVKAGSGDPATRARAISNALLAHEAEFFGLVDISELREQRITTSPGYEGEYINIFYTRYIGDLPLENSDIHVELGPDESIRYLQASLIPVPAELYEAVTHKKISQENARQIIENDAKTKNANSTKFGLGKIMIFATPAAPYVVWKGSVSLDGGKLWKYEVNAFTGEIITRRKTSLRD